MENMNFEKLNTIEAFSQEYAKKVTQVSESLQVSPLFFLQQVKAALHVTVGCRRCLGKGIIRSCMHVEAGICFKCWGSGDEKNPAPRPRR